MRLIIQDNSDAVSEWAARYVKKKILKFNPSAGKLFTLGLPTGSTPLGMYRVLADFVAKGEVSFKYVKTFNMDEYVGLPESHEQSYHSFMLHNFFKHIDIDPLNVHILNGNAADLQAECDDFEEKIKSAGGIELFIAGMGSDGHVAFNEPCSSLASRTRIKTLTLDTVVANARFFNGQVDQVPRQALTVGVATVMDAREVLILVTGVHKSLALQKSVEEGINHNWTASAFQYVFLISFVPLASCASSMCVLYTLSFVCVRFSTL